MTDNSLGSITVLYPTNKATIDVPINTSCYNFTSAGFAVRLELDDKSQAYSIDLKGRNLTYVYFNKSKCMDLFGLRMCSCFNYLCFLNHGIIGIVVGFTVSEMNVTAKQHSIEICVNVTHPLPGIGPITMTISSGITKTIPIPYHYFTKTFPLLSTQNNAAPRSDNTSMVTLSESRPVSCIQRSDTPHAGLVIYSLSSKDTRQPLDIFPDTLTVTVTG